MTKIIQFDDVAEPDTLNDGEIIILVAKANQWNNSYSVCEFTKGKLIPLASPNYNLISAKAEAQTFRLRKRVS